MAKIGKTWTYNKKDPLDLDIKETGKAIVRGAVVCGLGIPLISKLFGGND